ncbi:MAG: ubiquinol-cytochrome c reductase iron-sulfur subunit, partial [Quisquiliibacterium sp.]
MSDSILPDDPSRRSAVVTTCAVGAAGSAAVAWPFLKSMRPSERALAAGAPVEVDISDMSPGELKRVEWRGKPVWVVRRTPEMLAAVKKVENRVADPSSKRSAFPTPQYARNEHRSIKPEYLVVVGICTHLGCSPSD